VAGAHRCRSGLDGHPDDRVRGGSGR
jgi:hypothetical protein